MFNKIVLPSIFLALFLDVTEAYKILIYSQTLTRSHVILNARVGEALAEDGHDVTILEVEYIEPLANFSGSQTQAKGVRKIEVPTNYLANSRADIGKLLAAKTFKEQSLWDMAKALWADIQFYEGLNEICEKFVEDQPELMDQLKKEHFDLFIGEQINFCGSALSHLLNIPVHVLLVSCPIQEHVASLLGLPFPTSYVPSIYGIPMGDKMTISERFYNWLGAMVHQHAFMRATDHLTGIFRQKFGPNFPEVRDIVKESPLVFVNVDEFVEFPRPLFPNIVYIGGLEFEQRRNTTTALEEPFKSELEKGAKGVVFFSLGSLVNSDFLPETFRRNLFAAFQQLPEWHFVVKVGDADTLSRELASKMPNVFLTGWAPQKAILAHPRTKLFITHGGYNSLMESALAGCPVLTMGFFADQRRNGLVTERNGWGIAFDKAQLLEGVGAFREAMHRLLEEPGFRQVANRLKLLLATKPFSAREKLVRHVRFLEQSGGRLPELQAISRNLSTPELYNLDVIGVAGAVAIVVLAFVWILVRFCCRLCIRIGRKKTKRE